MTEKLKRCKNKVKTLWNFGTYVIVPCGFKEGGVMPLLCCDHTND